jgi:hypothetical protein
MKMMNMDRIRSKLSISDANRLKHNDMIIDEFISSMNKLLKKNDMVLNEITASTNRLHESIDRLDKHFYDIINQKNKMGALRFEEVLTRELSAISPKNMTVTLDKTGMLFLSKETVEKIGIDKTDMTISNMQWYGLISCDSDYLKPNPFTISFVYMSYPTYKENLYPLIKHGNTFCLDLQNSLLFAYMTPANYILECNNRETKYFFTYRLIRCAEKINEKEINISKNGVNNTKHKRNNIKKGKRSI